MLFRMESAHFRPTVTSRNNALAQLVIEKMRKAPAALMRAGLRLLRRRLRHTSDPRGRRSLRGRAHIDSNSQYWRPYQWTEQQAYERLRNESRRLRKPIREIAEAILLVEGLGQSEGSGDLGKIERDS
jgi:hypothetical protein